jgi:glycosyltransferase involved in cell wall biosynthesis
MKRLVFTVTNDLSYDQRMIRICTSLAQAGYDVMLVGRKMKGSIPLTKKPFRQKRLLNFFPKGKAFYFEYNLHLFCLLLFKRADLICAIDLDTILPCYFAARMKGAKMVYDAHELFCEMKEVVTRPKVYRFWKKIERFAVPKFKYGYTVNTLIRDEFKKMYDRNYEVIRSVPLLQPLTMPEETVLPASRPERYVLYQGAVNEGRSFETLIPAFKNVYAKLLIAGDGNFMKQARQLVKENRLEEKVVFLGKLAPDKLFEITTQAWIGVTIFENKGLSNYYSLANRFFDYIQAGIPQLCVNYPAYAEINDEHKIALMINDLSSENIAKNLNKLLEDENLYSELHKNCMMARAKLNWQEEEKKLLHYYQSIFS